MMRREDDEEPMVSGAASAMPTSVAVSDDLRIALAQPQSFGTRMLERSLNLTSLLLP
jgi:hypothetical protein